MRFRIVVQGSELQSKVQNLQIGNLGATSGLRPYHFTYPERRLTMEEMLYKFIDEGKREHEEMMSFICEFRTTNELLFKERNNSLYELRFEVQELLKVIDNVHAEEPLVLNHDKPVESNKVLDKDQPQTSKRS
ncbi:hypothetical protein Tco_0968995 [Tanacetum coccineum]